MPAASDPASPPKLSRYRSLRNKNAPASRRLVEPVPAMPTRTASVLIGNGNGNSNGSGGTASVPGQVSSKQPHILSPRNTLPVSVPPGKLTTGGPSGPVSPEGTSLPTFVPLQPSRDTDRLLAEQKKKDLERLQRELAVHEPSHRPSKSPIRDRFAFLTRRRGRSSTNLGSPPLPSSPANAILNGATHPPAPQAAENLTTSSPLKPSSAPIPKSVEAVSSDLKPPPLVDAPGANRHIAVHCRQFSTKIPVLPETTVADVLQLCSASFPINPETSTLVESYTRLGLERRLRRYERIRDIVDSWDTESENILVVVPGDGDGEGGDAPARAAVDSRGRKRNSRDAKSGHGFDIGRNGHANDLLLASVSRSRTSPPDGIVFTQLYHSQKPGRWSKRYVSLLEESGQMVASKKADSSRLAALIASESNGGSKSGGGSSSSSDFQKLCHLSDYDIYTPTETQLRKRLKAPKKFCFAVKSQQRTNVFQNTENYVHFFSTDDPIQARLFYDRVFGWRSWYLVNRKLALPSRSATSAVAKKKQLQETQAPMLPPMPPSSSSAVKAVPLQRDPSKRAASRPPPDRHAVSNRLIDLHAGDDFGRSRPAGPPDESRNNGDSGVFDAYGLLGSAYDERKKAEAARQRGDGTLAFASRDEAFTTGPSLLNGGTAALPTASRPEQSSWLPSAAEHTARQRGVSTAREAKAPSRPASSSGAPLPSQPRLHPSLQSPHHHTHDRSVSGSGAFHSSSAGYHQLADDDRPLTRGRSVRHADAPPATSHPAMPPQPLVDLTPKFQEPPQWSREGRGRGVRAPPGVTHLVDLATGPNGIPGSGTADGPPTLTTFLRRDDPANLPTRSNTVRAHTMNSASASVAAGFARNRQSVKRSSREADMPPMPLLSRIPANR